MCALVARDRVALAYPHALRSAKIRVWLLLLSPGIRFTHSGCSVPGEKSRHSTITRAITALMHCMKRLDLPINPIAIQPSHPKLIRSSLHASHECQQLVVAVQNVREMSTTRDLSPKCAKSGSRFLVRPGFITTLNEFPFLRLLYLHTTCTHLSTYTPSGAIQLLAFPTS